MKGYRKVLVAVNGSLHVLHRGMQLARDEKTWLTVLKVVPPYDGDINLTGIRNIEDVLEGGWRDEARTIEQEAEKERILLKTRIETGAVHEKIVSVADEERCDLIVVGRPKHKWLGSIIGDRTVEKVVSKAHCPVLVVDP